MSNARQQDLEKVCEFCNKLNDRLTFAEGKIEGLLTVIEELKKIKELKDK